MYLLLPTILGLRNGKCPGPVHQFYDTVCSLMNTAWWWSRSETRLWPS